MRGGGMMMMMLVVVMVMHTVAVLAAPNTTLYFFPAECSLPTALTERKCCPEYLGSVCGSSLSRGVCSTILITDTDSDAGGLCNGDDPVATFWFNDYFDDACLCTGNYWGASCELCAPGWSGDDCLTALPLRVRKDIDTLTDAELDYVVGAFQLMKTTPHPYWPDQSIWTWMVSLHQWSSNPLTNNGTSLKPIDYSHDGPALLHWHRIYQWMMEQYMADALQDPTFAIPYWNFTRLGFTSKAVTLTGGTGDLMSGGDDFSCFAEKICACSVDSGAFANWTCTGLWGEQLFKLTDATARMPIQRGLACMSSGWLPSALSISECTHYWTHSMFTAIFQGLHGAVHRWLGYTMAYGSPPSDPVFFFYHSMVEVVMEQWIRTQMGRGVFTLDNIITSKSNVIGHSSVECATPIVPIITNRKMYVPSYSLGITYDFLVNDATADEPSVTTPYTLGTTAEPTDAAAYAAEMVTLTGGTSTSSTSTSSRSTTTAATATMKHKKTKTTKKKQQKLAHARLQRILNPSA